MTLKEFQKFMDEIRHAKDCPENKSMEAALRGGLGQRPNGCSCGLARAQQYANSLRLED